MWLAMAVQMAIVSVRYKSYFEIWWTQVCLVVGSPACAYAFEEQDSASAKMRDRSTQSTAMSDEMSDCSAQSTAGSTKMRDRSAEHWRVVCNERPQCLEH